MRSNLILLVAVAIGIVSADPDISDCKDATKLSSCTNDAANKATACSTTDCACSAASDEMQCFKDYCPEVTVPSDITSQLDSLCGSGTSSGSGSSSGSDAGGGAGMLSVPVGGLLVGVVGALTLL